MATQVLNRLFFVFSLGSTLWGSCQQQPYGPHSPPSSHDHFFQGWYTRITAQEGLSFAFVIGQYVPGDLGPAPLAHPPVLCMALLQPQSPSGPLHAYTRMFTNMTIITDEPDGGPQSGQPPRDGTPDGIPRFAVLTKRPALHGHNLKGTAKTTYTYEGVQSSAHPSDVLESCSCSLRVNERSVSLEAHFPGSISLQVSSTGEHVAITPWSPSHASPEGWVGNLGSLVSLHYATLSLATPVVFNLTLMQDWDLESRSTANVQGIQGSGSKVYNGLTGVGVAHLEAQYGRSFPAKWLWAQGHTVSNTKSRGAAVAVPEQAHATQSFVLAGGDLPHRLSPPLPPLHQFLFAYRDPAAGITITVDPWNPPLPWVGITEDVDACAGRLHLQLATLTHIIEVQMDAPPASFTPVACPSEVGFTELSVESYATTTYITIYKRSLITRCWLTLMRVVRSFTLHFLSHLYATMGPAEVPREDAIQGLYERCWLVGHNDLIVNATFTSAALEYGGLYRCQ